MNSKPTDDTKPTTGKALTAADVAKKVGKLTYINDKGKEAKVTEDAILSFREDGNNIHIVTADGRKHLIEG